MATRIEVDFNSRDDEGFVPALVTDADGPLQPGTWVEAFDAAGFTCLAMVISATGAVAALDPIWRTFAEPGESRLVLANQPGSMTAGEWSSPLSVTLVQTVPTHVQITSSQSLEPEHT